nr:hypothetical protein [Tanacetum cinerariifolium]
MELKDEVAHELLNAPQDEEPRAPRGIDDGGEEIRNSIANERATGEGAVTTKEGNNKIKQNEQTTKTIDELDETDQLFENNDIGLENLIDCDDVQVTSEMKAPTKITPKSKKRKLEENDVFISKITSSLDNISTAIDQSTKAKIYKELELMGLERHEIPSAYLFLVDNLDKTCALFGAPNEMWLTILAIMMA